MGPSITIKYNLTKDLYRSATLHLTRKVIGASLWISCLWMGVLATLFTHWILSTLVMTSSSPQERLIVAVLVAGVIVAVIVYQTRKAASAVEPQEMSFIFSEAGVEKRSLHAEAKLEWKAYVKFSETNDFYFLHYSKALVDIVPKAAFASPQDATSFRELLTRQVRPNALDPHPRWGRKWFLLLILIYIVIMVLVWTKPVWHPRSAADSDKPAIQDR